MSTSAQYASVPRTPFVRISTANTNRDGTGVLGIVATAPGTPGNGKWVGKISITATATTTAGMVRLYVTQGLPGATITSITFATTTATMTTSVPHGRTTGNLVTVEGAFPDDYNVNAAAITVTGANTFTYPMSTIPTAVASTVGNYSTTPATPVTRLWREIPVTAITPSGTVAAFTITESYQAAGDIGYLPLSLEPGYSLRASTNNAESFDIIATFGGDLS